MEQYQTLRPMEMEAFPDWDNSSFKDQVSYFNDKTLLIPGIE